MPIKKTQKTDYQHAGVWRRFSAMFLDGFILGLLSSALSGMFFRGSVRGDNVDFSFNYFPGLIISFAYYAFFWIEHDGQTIGKKVMGIKIVRQDGKPIDLVTAVTRCIGYLISGAVFGIGYISATFNKKKLTWHDRLAKTYVVVVGKTNKLVSVIAIAALTVFTLFLAGGLAFGLFVTKKAVETIKPEHIEQGLDQLDRLNQNLEKYQNIEDIDMQKLQDIKDSSDSGTI